MGAVPKTLEAIPAVKISGLAIIHRGCSLVNFAT
jgi:hypothetical protein